MFYEKHKILEDIKAKLKSYPGADKFEKGESTTKLLNKLLCVTVSNDITSCNSGKFSMFEASWGFEFQNVGDGKRGLSLNMAEGRGVAHSGVGCWQQGMVDGLQEK